MRGRLLEFPAHPGRGIRDPALGPRRKSGALCAAKHNAPYVARQIMLRHITELANPVCLSEFNVT